MIFYSVIQLSSCLANILFIAFGASDDVNYTCSKATEYLKPKLCTMTFLKTAFVPFTLHFQIRSNWLKKLAPSFTHSLFHRFKNRS